MANNNNNRTPQNNENNIDVNQFQDQGLIIRNSHTVDVTQTEVQGLVLVQAALQAAIEAAIVVLGSNENTDVRNLQRIAQNLEVTQAESQRVVILDSDAITVRQTEVQIDVVVQAAIQLLAQLALRVG
ncbi:spore coat protein [Solibacillus silvestris]